MKKTILIITALVAIMHFVGYGQHNQIAKQKKTTEDVRFIFKDLQEENKKLNYFLTNPKKFLNENRNNKQLINKMLSEYLFLGVRKYAVDGGRVILPKQADIFLGHYRDGTYRTYTDSKTHYIDISPKKIKEFIALQDPTENDTFLHIALCKPYDVISTGEVASANYSSHTDSLYLLYSVKGTTGYIAGDLAYDGTNSYNHVDYPVYKKSIIDFQNSNYNTSMDNITNTAGHSAAHNMNTDSIMVDLKNDLPAYLTFLDALNKEMGYDFVIKIRLYYAAFDDKSTYSKAKSYKEHFCLIWMPIYKFINSTTEEEVPNGVFDLNIICPPECVGLY